MGGCYPFVQIGDLPSEGGTIRGYRQTLNEKGVLVSKIFPKGSVLLAIVGDTIANTGILSFDSCCPDSLVGLHGASGPLSSFAEVYLSSTKLSLRRVSNASGGQPNINRYERKETDRFRPFAYEDLLKRDKASLDIFWRKDENLEDSTNLADPDVIAAEIAEDLQAALDQFAQIASDLKR